MKDIRIGNDIHIRWHIMCSGEPEDFTGKEVTVTLADSMGREAYIEWSAVGSDIEVTFRGRQQVYTGTYTLTLTENRGQDGMVTVDRQKVFRLVPKQDSVISDSGSCGCHCGLAVETVELMSELQIPSLGKGVIHVYNIARSVWGNGLESDGETVNVKVAEDSADVLSVDRDGLHINKDSIGTGGGTAITPEEIDEIMGISKVEQHKNDLE
ncbi:MAG: hypothetical protein K2H16_06135 [Prevotella sp.]|nr:hypothetical protein [Prevotella sp.]